MDLIKKILFACVLAIGASATLPAATSEHSNAHDRDHEALAQFVNSKRTITLSEKDDFMDINGDIRVEHISKTERIVPPVGEKYKKTRHLENVKLNLGIGYKADGVKAYAKLFFANSAGINPNIHSNEADDVNGLFGSGTADRLCLKEAWIEKELYEYCGYNARLFLGRIGLDKKFESAVQFGARFNGFLFEVDKKFEPSWKVYAKIGSFVVDQRVNHFAHVAEIGALDIMEYKVDLIYNFITWNECSRNRAGTHHPEGFRFRNSQIYAAYNIPHVYYGFDGKFYGAFVYNHAARRNTLTPNSSQNKAGYVGFTASQGRKEGNLTMKVEYQAVQAQAIPDADANGIGNGNFQGHTFTDGSGLGEGNYHGFKVSSVYYILDCLVLESSYNQTKELKKSLGGKHDYRKFASELIFQF